MRKLFFCILSCLLIIISINYTIANSAHIKTAEFQSHEASYFLSAEAEIDLNPTIKDVLDKGIPLTFIWELQIISPRRYWFDDILVKKTAQITLSYHELSRLYLVSSAMLSAPPSSFSSLTEALVLVGKIKNWRIGEENNLKKSPKTFAQLSLKLQTDELPGAIQIEAIHKEFADLVADYKWRLN